MSFGNIFDQANSSVTYVRIVQKNSNTLCTVRDMKGRLSQVESDGSYSVGQSVSVKSGVVIGRVKMPKAVRHFNV